MNKSVSVSSPPIHITVLEECASTMDVASKMFYEQTASARPALPFAVQALSQTKGRGSGEREWKSPRGNLYLNIVLAPPSAKRVMHLFPCILAIALHTALNRVVTQHAATCTSSFSSFQIDSATSPLVLKWPNDVLIRSTGAKVCGNLVESLICKDRNETALNIGIGVNVATGVVISDGGRPGATLMDAVQFLIDTMMQQQQQRLRENSGNEDHQQTKSDTPTRSDAVAPEKEIPQLDAGVVAQLVCAELLSVLDGAVRLPDGVVPEFARRLDMKTLVYKRVVGGQARDETPLQPLRVTEHGTLIAKSTITEEEVELSAEYLF